MEKLIQKLEKLDTISRKRWLSQFPSHFPEEKWNGHWQREECLLIKDIEGNYSKKEVKEAARESDVTTYFLSQNIHNDVFGLDTQDTPQGGGVIANADSEQECLKIAKNVYGINKYFIIH